MELQHRERKAGATAAAGTAAAATAAAGTAAAVKTAVETANTVAVLATDPEKAAVAAKVLATDQEQNQ